MYVDAVLHQPAEVGTPAKPFDWVLSSSAFRLGLDLLFTISSGALNAHFSIQIVWNIIIYCYFIF